MSMYMYVQPVNADRSARISAEPSAWAILVHHDLSGAHLVLNALFFTPTQLLGILDALGTVDLIGTERPDPVDRVRTVLVGDALDRWIERTTPPTEEQAAVALAAHQRNRAELSVPWILERAAAILDRARAIRVERHALVVSDCRVFGTLPALAATYLADQRRFCSDLFPTPSSTGIRPWRTIFSGLKRQFDAATQLTAESWWFPPASLPALLTAVTGIEVGGRGSAHELALLRELVATQLAEGGGLIVAIH
ncbi:MAG: hypothetical protein ABMA64_02740 [Myxococcota bacterium]